MKKLIIGIVLTAAVLILSLYVLIPGRLKINESLIVNVPLPAMSRSLSNTVNWVKWWPGDPGLGINKKKFLVMAHNPTAYVIIVAMPNDSLKTRLSLSFITDDSILVNWQTEARETSSNPFRRYAKYRETKKIQDDINKILSSLKTFAENPENIYGIKINKTFVTDAILISTRRSFDHKPDVYDIDSMIRRLRNFITQNGAVEKNLPMLNVMKIDSSHFEVMTAISVDRELPGTREFVPKFMLKGGNILEVEVKGGPSTIERSFNELENYRTDHKYMSPAIPFQLLVTDRAKENDTAKWITKLYYPIY
jgi:hypothetical protein